VPTYQYRCTDCDHAFEQFQSFTDDALTVCPVCGGRLRKLFNAVGVVFKGSGFYRNDSRATGVTSEAGSSSGESSADSSGSKAPAPSTASKDSTGSQDSGSSSGKTSSGSADSPGSSSSGSSSSGSSSTAGSTAG
jgi:putative FmdB family regulatory protein